MEDLEILALINERMKRESLQFGKPGAESDIDDWGKVDFFYISADSRPSDEGKTISYMITLEQARKGELAQRLLSERRGSITGLFLISEAVRNRFRLQVQRAENPDYPDAEIIGGEVLDVTIVGGEVVKIYTYLAKARQYSDKLKIGDPLNKILDVVFEAYHHSGILE
tara:strand:- start:3622 stop:4125 length:504 start_codon:yes stop_codon:yes gene_type:complete